MKNLKNRLFVITLFLISGALLVSCGNSEKKSVDEKEVIKIGAILPLTGPAALYGEQVRSGQQKALQYLNENVLDDKKIEILFEDGKGIPRESVNAYMKLRNQDVRVFNTTTSSVSLALVPKAKSDSVLLFADAAHPNITSQESDLIFRHSNTTNQEAELIIDYLNKSSFEKVAVIYLNDDYGIAASTTLIERLKADSDFELVLAEGYDSETVDLNTLTQKINLANPDITIVISFGQTMGNLVRKIKELRLRTHILASIGFIITGADAMAGEAASGIDYVDFDFQNIQDSGTQEVNSFEMLGYGTTILLGNAINEVGGNPQAIAEYIKSLETFDTGAETMTILPTNDILPKLKIDTYE